MIAMKRLLIGVLISGSLLAAAFSWMARKNLLTDNLTDEPKQTDESSQAYFYKEIGTTAKNTVASSMLPPRAQYTAEIMTTTRISEAQNSVFRLTAKGLDVFYTPLNRNGEVIFRVRSGVFASKKEAQGHVRHLKQAHQINSQVAKF